MKRILKGTQIRQKGDRRSHNTSADTNAISTDAQIKLGTSKQEMDSFLHLKHIQYIPLDV